MTHRPLSALLLLPLLLGACRGAEPAPTRDAYGASLDRMAWWRDARFGLFLHFGLYAIPAGRWGDEEGHAEWIMNTAHIPVEQYEQFLPRFNPVHFDADAWVRMAKAAGMKYVVITTKHHDGFALFDSAVSDYDVMATPFGRDIMAELAAACRREGLRMCWYHSIMDWHHPDYLPRRGWETRSAEGADFDRYVDYLHAQVTELLTNYGDVGVMWFDGEWESTWNHREGRALYDLCRRLQPNVIVNNRVDVGRAGLEGFSEGDQHVGDFGTPEQTIPDTGIPGVDWETCMTMNDHWGFNAADHNWKSTRELLRKLVDIASKGGNFLLNVGPRADGTFPPEAVERLAGIGRWMDVHGEAIHGTQASPIERPDWGRVTAKELEGGDTMLYLCVFDWPADGRLLLGGLGNEVREAHWLEDPTRAVTLTGGDGTVIVSTPPKPLDPDVSVLAVRLAGAPIVYGRPTIEAPSAEFLDALDVTLRPPSPEIEVRYALGSQREAGTGGTPEQVWDGTPLHLTETTIVRAQSFHDGRPVSPPVERRFARVSPLPAHPMPSKGEPGVRVSEYRGRWDALPGFGNLTPSGKERQLRIELPAGYREEEVARAYDGWLDVPETAMWTFALESDDGSRLLLDDRVVVDNDGLHGTAEERGTIGLAAGAHRLRVEWFNKTGGASLGLRWAKRGEPLGPVDALFVTDGAD